MAGADKQFDVAKARGWKKEVEAEFSEVNVLLKRVAEECQQKPYEDDTLLNAFHETGKKLNDTWNELNKQFKAVTIALEGIASQWEKILAKGIEEIQEYASKIRI